jgi:tRNA(fMet)-specific endonuclease VapC
MAQVFISAVTEGELRYGVARRPAATKLHQVVEEFLHRVTVLPWDSDAARQYGRLRADLERLGQSMGNLDMMIGAQAMAAGAILVSNDRAFTRIKKLTVEDWTI